jgi:Tol biopolymer transport system component
MKLSRVTQSGNAVNVAISPDGHYIVYVLREGEKQSLNVRQVATGSAVQILAPDEIVIWGLTFSPDGNYIDFIRSQKNNVFDTYLYRIPVLGGTPHLVMQGGIDGSNSYSPNGTQFAFLRVGDSGRINVLITNTDGTRERVLATRPYLDFFSGTAWSPDGRTIAFTTWEAKERVRGVLWAISISDGSVREIYSTQGLIGRPRWLPDGSGLLAPIDNPDTNFRGQLWFISFPKGQARRLTNDLMGYQDCCLDLTQDGSTLVDTELTRESDLWVAPAADTTKARQITPKGPPIGRFSWMPDGRTILAEEDGSVIGLNADGSGRTLLNANNGEKWNPSVCGDGRYVVYSAYQEQKVGIWRMDLDGSNPTRIADETFAAAPQCSPDGKWVVYVRGTSDIPMRVAIGGDKPPEPLAQTPAFGLMAVAAISPDGKQIAYLAYPDSPVGALTSPSTSRPNQLRVISFDGGALLHQLDWPSAAGDVRWAPGGGAIDYELTRNRVSNIWRQRLAGGAPTQITNFKSGQIFDFDWSRDGKQLALTRGTDSSDVILIRSFR